MFKKVLSFIVFFLVAFVSYLLFNTITLKSKQINYLPAEKIDISDSAIHHLARAIRIKTISPGKPLEFDSTEFYKFNDFLTATYPLTSLILQKKLINNFSLLYKWEGKNKSLKPVVLVAHMDVVPVPEEDLERWTAPPYSGKIVNGMLWGRGAVDDKVGVVGIMEAVEQLVSSGFEPDRTIYLAFGHDKEIGGLNGARAIVDYLNKEGIEAEFVLNEGYTIARGLVPGVLTDVAQIGIAEKGFASIRLSVELGGGSSSMTNAEVASIVIDKAKTKLESNPFPPEITKPLRQFLRHVGPEMRFQDELIFANSDLFTSVIIGNFQQSEADRALIQTTMVPTIFNSDFTNNTNSTKVTATVNFRILPGLTIENLIHRVKEIIDDDRIQITLNDFHSEASTVSSTDSEGYAIINQSIKEIFPDVITVPNLVTGATDGRYYSEICDNIYRFLPIRLNPDNIKAIHGMNENIPVDEFKDVVRFYMRLIKNCD